MWLCVTDFLHLASVFEVHLCHSMFQYFISPLFSYISSGGGLVRKGRKYSIIKFSAPQYLGFYLMVAWELL